MEVHYNMNWSLRRAGRQCFLRTLRTTWYVILNLNSKATKYLIRVLYKTGQKQWRCSSVSHAYFPPIRSSALSQISDIPISCTVSVTKRMALLWPETHYIYSRFSAATISTASLFPRTLSDVTRCEIIDDLTNDVCMYGSLCSVDFLPKQFVNLKSI